MSFMNQKEFEDISNYPIYDAEIEKSCKKSNAPREKTLNIVEIQNTKMDEEDNKENTEGLSKNVSKFYGKRSIKSKFVFNKHQKTRSAQTVKKKPLFPSPPESPKFHSNTTRNRSSVKEKLEKFLPNNENSKPFQTSTLDENSDLEKTSQILRPIQIPTLATRSVTGMVGLYNLGNTCYMNSIIQAMYMSQIFREMVLQCPSNSDLELMMKMKETFAFLKGTLKATYSPSNLLKIARPPGFESGMQQDCSEFLKYLLDTLHEQEKSSAASLLENFESMVHKLFGGKLQATIQCLKCKSVSHNEESFTNLDLPFPEKKQNSENTTIAENFTMQTFLANFFTPETLQGENKYACEKCGSNQDALKTMKIIEGPKYLTATLKRFHYDRTQSRQSKLLTDIQYTLDLNLPIYINDEPMDQLYSLYAIVVHSGNSLDGGHYYTYAREAMSSAETDLETYNKTSSWYSFNDSKVKCFTFESFKSWLKQRPKDTAYLFFYEKYPQDTSLIQKASPPSTVPKLKSEVELNVDIDNEKFLRKLKAGDGDVTKMSEEEQIEFAIQQSLNVSMGTEEQQFKLALEQSLNDSKGGGDVLSETKEDEEQLLLAIKQSLVPLEPEEKRNRLSLD